MTVFLTKKKEKSVLLPMIDKVKKRGKAAEKWEEIHKEKEHSSTTRGHEKDRSTGKGGWKHAGHLNSKAEQEQFNASANVGTFLNCLA